MKSILPIFSALLVISLMIYSVVIKSTVEVQKETIVNQQGVIEGLDKTNRKIKVERDEYEAENVVLRDSIETLNIVIDNLKVALRNKENEVDRYKRDFSNKTAEYEKLKEKIRQLSQEKKINRSEITRLEKDKAMLKSELESSYASIDKANVEIDRIKKETVQRVTTKKKYTALSQMVHKINVRFNRMVPRKHESRGDISSLKRKNNWNFTVVEFFLDYPEYRELLKKQFAVKIFNSDTGVPLSIIEENPRFPDSSKDTKRIAFDYDGNMVELVHQNFSKKTGNNYHLQVYLLDNGQEIPIPSGKKTIFSNRKLAK